MGCYIESSLVPYVINRMDAHFHMEMKVQVKPDMMEQKVSYFSQKISACFLMPK